MRRIDYKLIEDLVPDGSTVLDLACGDGELLSELIAEKHVRGSGVEIDQAAVEKCIGRGLSVFHGDLDAGLADFDDQSHDVVILSLSLQQLRRPRMIVREMVRVGRLAIVSFPNFAHWVPRSQLLLRGRMPVSRDLPYQWWDTPNIHLCTIQDFRALCREEGLCIEHEQYLRSVEKPPPARARGPEPAGAHRASSSSRAASGDRARLSAAGAVPAPRRPAFEGPESRVHYLYALRLRERRERHKERIIVTPPSTGGDALQDQKEKQSASG